MYRKRLIGMFSALLVSLSAGPAAAIDVPVADQSLTVEVAERAAEAAGAEEASVEAVELRALDPEIDQEVPGVGRVIVDADESGSLTVSLAVYPAGVDETVTLGAPGADEGDEPEQGPAADETTSSDAAAEREQMDRAKEANAEKLARTPRPAFRSGTQTDAVSGQVASGAGVARSELPASSTSAGNNAAAPLPEAASNPWVQLMGVVMLAGTSTAWSIAKREGLA